MTGVRERSIEQRVETSGLSDHALLERVASIEAEIARLQARQLDLLAEFAERPARDAVGRAVVSHAVAQSELSGHARATAEDEVAQRLRLSRRAAGARLDVARGLSRLPRTRDALASGLIDLSRARVIVDEVADLDPLTAREVEACVIEAAPRLTAARLRARVRRAVLAVDPLAADGRHEQARGDRRVVVEPASDGMAWLSAYLTAAEARTVHGALTAAARAAKATSDSGIDALRADALVAVCADALRTGELPGVGQLARHLGEVTTIQVTVAASTLLGFDDAPAHLDGYGPITANEARALAPDARWRRVLTDPTSGAVLDVGSAVYRPPAPIVRYVEARDVHCVAPGCGVSAARCDLDHVVPFPNGPTSAANLRAECRHHHRLKHHPTVNVATLDDSGTRWTMPTGHVYDTHPPPVGLVTDDRPPELACGESREPWWADWADWADAAEEPPTDPVSVA